MISRARIEAYGPTPTAVARELDIATSHLWGAAMIEGIGLNCMGVNEQHVELIKPTDPDFEQHTGAGIYGFAWKGRKVVKWDGDDSWRWKDDTFKPKADIYGLAFGNSPSMAGCPYRVLMTAGGKEIDITDAVIVMQRNRVPQAPTKPRQDAVDLAFHEIQSRVGVVVDGEPPEGEEPIIPLERAPLGDFSDLAT